MIGQKYVFGIDDVSILGVSGAERGCFKHIESKKMKVGFMPLSLQNGVCFSSVHGPVCVVELVEVKEGHLFLLIRLSFQNSLP